LAVSSSLSFGTVRELLEMGCRIVSECADEDVS
jgi:hypothetical protein